MMAASSGFTGASTGRIDGFRASSSSPSTSEPNHSSNGAADVDFSSFAAAERLSDPFGDVYGAEADFGDFVGGQEQSVGPSAAAGSSSLMLFSPLTAPVATTAPPTLLPSISGEIDPFADITGGLGAAADTTEATAQNIQTAENFMTSGAVGTAPTSTILDLVWGKTTHDSENPLSISSTSVGPTSGGDNRTTSNPTLPPPPSTTFAAFSSAAPATTTTPEASTGDLLSFSPVQATAPRDPFFGIANNSSETSAAIPVFGTDDLFALTPTPPLSTASSSTPTSLHGSFASLHEDARPSVHSHSTPGSVEAQASPKDLFSERTRSFGSLRSSFVSAGALEDNTASFNVLASATPETATTWSVTPSPSSAPPSLHSSFKLTDSFMSFAAPADELEELDPFTEAGLAAPVEMPLAEALAAWDPSVEPGLDTEDGDVPEENSQENANVTELLDESQYASNGDLESLVSADGIIKHTTSGSMEKEPLDVWHSVDIPTTSTSDRKDDDVFAGGFTQDDHAVHVTDSSAAAADSEDLLIKAMSETIEVVPTIEHEDRITDEKDDEVRAQCLHDIEFEDNSIATPVTETNIESTGFGSGDDVVRESTLHHDLPSVSPSVPATAPVEFPASSDEVTAVETFEENVQEEVVDGDDSDEFSGFGEFEVAAPPTTSAAVLPDVSPWGSSPSSTPVQNMPLEDENEAFGDFAGTFAFRSAADDGFADFAQSSETGGDDFGDFGEFTQSSVNDAANFPDFQQSESHASDEDDNGFGEFSPAITATSVDTTTTPSVLSAPSFSKTELSLFFNEAFTTEPVPTPSEAEPDSPTDVKDADVVQDSSSEFIQDVFCAICDEYISIVVATGRQSHCSSSLSSASELNDKGDGLRLSRNSTRASKYLKYVLSEKIQEASRQNGIFPHGSERHELYIGYAATGDAVCMRRALKELQDALFLNSVNDAMMRIAKQAALSAKAKIAEQAAQQQANSRGGSLFSTTRHLLSRGGSAASHGSGSSGNDCKSDHAGADTPTGASVQKLARFSFPTSHDEASTGRGVTTGDERGSEGSDHTGHSSGSDSEAANAGDNRTRNGGLSNGGSSNGGLMKKFQDRFSFASSRHRPRFVSLRRKGQSGEEVRKMELNLDAISGGLDEVKWKCAMFLYDVEEVAHVAPSQISILSYPSKQPLTGKTNRSALTKLVKPDTIWTVDIGVNNSDMLNEW